MKLNHLYLPILLSGTLILTGCGSAAEPGINPGGTESQPDDNEQRPNDEQGGEPGLEQGTGSNAGSESDNEPDTDNSPNTGSESDNETDTDK